MKVLSINVFLPINSMVDVVRLYVKIEHTINVFKFQISYPINIDYEPFSFEGVRKANSSNSMN